MARGIELTLHGELGAAGDLAAGGLRHTGVQAGVFGLDVLEDQRQGVLLILSQGQPISKGMIGHVVVVCRGT